MASGGDTNQNTLVFDWEAVSETQMDALKAATRSDHVTGMPPTYPTIYRWGEFEWLKRVGISLRDLLHTDQEYEYLAPLIPGVKPKVTTVLKSDRARAGMRFICLESSVECSGRVAVRCTTTFVIRSAAKGGT